MDAQTLSKYLNLFGDLHSNMNSAPHKPMLLLSVLDEIDNGHITNNRVVLDKFLVAAFLQRWQSLPLPTGNWKPRVWYPFRYLMRNGFWKLIKNGIELSANQVREPNSVKDMQGLADYASFAPDLWELLQDNVTRTALKQHLLQVHFGITPGQVQPLVSTNPLKVQLEKLIEESQSQPRPKKVKETADDTEYFIRHALFPQIIRTMYDDACAVCGLFARTDKSSIIEAAHIRPFATFHDDHPSNGLALCKDHHWGFDAGGFSITDEYTILIYPRLQSAPGYVTSGAPIHLPSSENCYPSPASLAYHREKFGKQ